MFKFYHLFILEYRNSWALGGRLTLDAGHYLLDSGRWILDAGLWMLDSEPWTLHARI